MLRLEGISKTFATGTPRELRILEKLDLLLEDGDFAILLGANGSGKSTLLKIIAGEVWPDAGRIMLDRMDVAALPRHKRVNYLSYIPQTREENLVSSLTVLEVFMLAMSRGRSPLAVLAGPAWEKQLRELLRSVGAGLEKRAREQIRSLSGGEHQLVSVLFAAEMIRRGYRRGVLLLDEHVVHLDPRSSKAVMSLTAELVDRYRLTTLMVTHNVQIAAEYGNRVLVLGNRNIVFDERYDQQKRREPSRFLEVMSAAYT